MKIIYLLFVSMLYTYCVHAQTFVDASKNNNGQTINLTSEQVLNINLLCQPSTGYGWYIVNADSSVIKQIGNWSFIPDSANNNNHMVGLPGTAVIRFIGTSQGTAELKLEYKQPWENDVPAIDSFKLTINTNGKYTGNYTAPVITESVQHLMNSSGSCKNTPTLPSSFSWQHYYTDHNNQIPIELQGSCGACWAFAGLGQLEGIIEIIDGVATQFSEQWLINCDYDGVYYKGCIGGLCPDNFLVQNPAVYNNVVPYQCQNSENSPCSGSCGTYTGSDVYSFKPQGALQVSGIGLISSYKQQETDQIKEAILNYGPVWVEVNEVPGGPFSTYGGGIFKTDEGTQLMNHAVVLVGWFDDPSLSNGGYWILRNSWGVNWGLSGYMYIEYGISGIGSYANYLNYKGGISCTTAPDPGNTITTVNSICNENYPFTLSLQNYCYPSNGLTYQWQSSTDGGTTWSNISSATNSTYTTTQATATSYECIVTCSGNSATSNPVEIKMEPSPINNYCLGTYNSCLHVGIANVTFGNINNTSSINCTNPYNYDDFTNCSTNIFSSSTNPISITAPNTSFQDDWGIWIDWNNTGYFDDSPSKFNQITNINSSNILVLTGTGNITVPSIATPGNHRMRIRAAKVQGSTLPLHFNNACTNIGFGNQQDYMINVIPCPATATIANQGPTTFCQGGNIEPRCKYWFKSKLSMAE